MKTNTACWLSELIPTTMSKIPNIRMALMREGGAMIANIRNGIVNRALAAGADYIFWVDSDMIGPADVIPTLMAHNKDIVGCTYRKRTHPYDLLGRFVEPNRTLSGGGLIEASHMPGGFMLVRTEVYKRIGMPYYFIKHHWRGESPMMRLINMLDDLSPVPMPDEVKTKFHSSQALRTWLDKAAEYDKRFDGDVVAEDYFWSQRAIRAGFKIWCDLDTTYKVAHLGELAIGVPQNVDKTFGEMQGEAVSAASPQTEVRPEPSPSDLAPQGSMLEDV